MIKTSSSNLEIVRDWIQKNVTDFNAYFKEADIEGLNRSNKAVKLLGMQ